MTVAAVVLAAGRSQRMGGANKLLADWNGRPLIAHVVAAVLASAARPVLVVTGYEFERIEAALGGLDVRFIRNLDHAQGLSASLKAGLGALKDEPVDGVLVCLGDMPKVSPATIARLLAEFAVSGDTAICAPAADGRRGNPVLWPADLLTALRDLSGDAGGRDLLTRHAGRLRTVAAPPDEIFIDVDTPEMLEDLRAGRAVRD